MEQDKWLNRIPSEFFEQIHLTRSQAYIFNCLIGTTQDDTSNNIRNFCTLLYYLAQQEREENFLFPTDEQASRAFVIILELMAGAMNFELKYRPNGGLPPDEEEPEKKP